MRGERAGCKRALRCNIKGHEAYILVMMFPRPANSNTSSRVKEIALRLLFSSTI